MGRRDGRDDEAENARYQFVYVGKQFGTMKFGNPKTKSIIWRPRRERAFGWATLGAVMKSTLALGMESSERTR